MFLLASLALVVLCAMIIYLWIIVRRILKNYNIELRRCWGIILLLFVALFFAVYTLGIGGISFIFLVYFILAELIIDFIYLIFKSKIKSKKIKSIYVCCVIPLIISTFAIAFGIFNVKNIVETRYVVYTNKKIGGDLRVLFIADSHYGGTLNENNIDSVKQAFDNVNADIVLLGGDIIDEGTTRKQAEDIFEKLGKVQNKYGIFYVYGNHDRQRYAKGREYTEGELKNIMEGNNIIVLRDENIALEDINVQIIGREDKSAGREDIELISKHIPKEKYIITLDHQPLDYKRNAKSGVDLILSGHTHAGQIFPVEWIIKFLKTADLAYGYAKCDKMDAIVTSGLVGWGFPVRTSRHSEYVVIDIVETD